MNYAEPVAARRRIPVYLVDAVGVPITGVAPTGAELRVSLSGGPLVNASGSFVERGGGAYFYECTVAECTTNSYLLLYLYVVGVNRTVWTTGIGVRMRAGETSAARRHIPIYLADTSGDPVVAATLTGTDIQISKAGGAFNNAVGTVTTVGDGVYDYEATFTDVTDVGPLVLKVDEPSAMPYLYNTDVVDDSIYVGGSSGYFGWYFGGGSAGSGSATPTPIPIPVPIVYGDPAYTDHTLAAIRRLPQQFKSGTVF